MRIKERSHYRILNSKGEVIQSGFHDLEDALEHAVNILLTTDEETVKIEAEIYIYLRGRKWARKRSKA